MRLLSELEGLTAADVVHRRLTAMPASATVAQLREYFGSSTSHRLAVLVDGDRYAGSLTATSIAGDAPRDALAAGFAEHEPTVRPDAPADDARDAALRQESHRIPVVDADGTLVGVVAITRDLSGFCGT
jgi:CBS domain-containing protein